LCFRAHRCGLVLGSTRCSGPGLHRTSTSSLLLYGVHTCSSPISVGFRHPAAPCRQGAEVMLSVLLPLEERGALLAGSFTRFWRFTIGQPYKVFPVVGRLSGLSARRSPVEAMRSVVCCAGC
jgi:hypothetical protein